MSKRESQPLPLPPYLKREAIRELPELQAAVERVVRSGRFLFGQELEQFEGALAASVGCSHGVGVGTGTDAIQVALRALDVGPGHEVITQSHSSPFTAIAIYEAGARPVYVESSEDDFGMDPDAMARAITGATKAILAVHLYGHPVRIEAILELANQAGVPVIEDCAQAQGATVAGHAVGSFGKIGCFSFYPTKNLGALGDSGAMVTDDANLAARARRLRNGGLSAHGVHAERGLTSRMDEIQAAILRNRLSRLDSANAARRDHATAYAHGLRGVRIPTVRAGCIPAPHQYVIRHPERDAMRHALAEQGLPLLVHYPLPIHLQRGFECEFTPLSSLPIAERLAAEVLSLPTHPEVTERERNGIITAINRWVAK